MHPKFHAAIHVDVTDLTPFRDLTPAKLKKALEHMIQMPDFTSMMEQHGFHLEGVKVADVVDHQVVAS